MLWKLYRLEALLVLLGGNAAWPPATQLTLHALEFFESIPKTEFSGSVAVSDTVLSEGTSLAST